MRIPGTFGLLPMSAARRTSLTRAIGLTLSVFLLVAVLELAIPGNPMPRWTIAAMVISLIGMLVIIVPPMAYPLWLAKNLQAELIDNGFLLHTSPYNQPGHFYAWSQIRHADARISSYSAERRLMPVYNMSNLGPTRLGNGDTAMVYVMDDKAPFVYLPVIGGPSLLLQIEAAEEFLEALQKSAPTPDSAVLETA